MNERLRRALAAAHLTREDLAQAANVDPKTVQHWIKGRIPHPRHRWKVAELLNVHEDVLWPIDESGRVLFEQQLSALWDIYHTGETSQAYHKLQRFLTNYGGSGLYEHASDILCMSYQLQGSLYRDMMKYNDAHTSYKQAFEIARELDDVGCTGT